MFFASEELALSDRRFAPITTGRGSYVTRLIRALRTLERAGFRYVLYLQEDMWIDEPVDRALLTELERMMLSHDLDCVKLGEQPFPEDHQDIRRNCERVGADGIARDFHWFGSHRFVLSHHVSLFRIRFLLEMSYAARLFGKTAPLAQERFCTAYLKPRTKAISSDRMHYRIAVFRDQPVVSYVHASSGGSITREALSLLRADGIEGYYAPGLDQ